MGSYKVLSAHVKELLDNAAYKDGKYTIKPFYIDHLYRALENADIYNEENPLNYDWRKNNGT